MLVQTIKQYLELHKRLVVPQLGAFIVKEPGGSVLFSELFRRDDGVLRGLLQTGGMTELEAAGAIDRFVFEIRLSVQDGGEYRLEGFGVFRPGLNDTLAFVYEPAPAVPEQSRQESVPGEPGRESDSEQSGRKAVPGEPAPMPEPVSDDKSAEDSRVPAGSVLQPDPTLKGLRYGKPLKTTDAYTYADRRGRRKTDRFLLVAIIAAIIAVAAIAFGYVHEAREKRAAQEFVVEPQPPQVQPAETPAAQNPTQTLQE